MGVPRTRLLVVALTAAALTPILSARPGRTTQDQPQPGVDAAFYDKEVLPVLKANCYKCHVEKTRGGLSLATRSGLLKGGDSGPAVNLQKPDESLLLKAVNHQNDLQMPPAPAPKLAAGDIDILTRWVKAGVPGIDDRALALKKGFQITDEDRRYWAYTPVRRPDVPAVKNRAWVTNPIAAFILPRLEAKGLTPAPPADRHALVRRVYYDLTGLPPTPEEVDAFVNDQRADAYERLIDKLLDSPHYGEKWARHWPALLQYAATNGIAFDQTKPWIWGYRHWLIEAFNKYTH